MDTLIVISLLNGRGPTGVETHFNNIIKHALSKGIDARLISPEKTNSLLRKITYLIELLLKLFSMQIAFIFLRKRYYFLLGSAIKKVLKDIKANRIVLYAQDPLSAGAAFWAKNKLNNKNIQVSTVVHFNVSEGLELVQKGICLENDLLYKSLFRDEKKYLFSSDKILFVSNFMSKIVNSRIKNLNIKPQSILPNYTKSHGLVDCETRKAKLDIICIGTLEHRKNQKYILKVISNCNKIGKKYNLSVIGNGIDIEILKHYSIKLGINDQVKFLGFIPNASSIISEHKILAHSSLMESFGIVAIEAFSQGRPVIAAPVGGIAEVVKNGVNGIFWNLNDADEGARLLISILDDLDYWIKLCNGALSSFNSNFSETVLADKWLSEICDF